MNKKNFDLSVRLYPSMYGDLSYIGYVNGLGLGTFFRCKELHISGYKTSPVLSTIMSIECIMEFPGSSHVSLEIADEGSIRKFLDHMKLDGLDFSADFFEPMDSQGCSENDPIVLVYKWDEEDEYGSWHLDAIFDKDDEVIASIARQKETGKSGFPFMEKLFRERG